MCVPLRSAELSGMCHALARVAQLCTAEANRIKNGRSRNSVNRDLMILPLRNQTDVYLVVSCTCRRRPGAAAVIDVIGGRSCSGDRITDRGPTPSWRGGIIKLIETVMNCWVRQGHRVRRC